jgi:hypothetical protein
MSAIKDIDKLIKQAKKDLTGVPHVGLRGWVENLPFIIEQSKGANKVKLQNYQNLINQKQKLLNPPPEITKKYGGKISPRRANYS